MAYFNHAFTKMFIGTQVTGGGAGQNPNNNLTDGFVITAGIPTVALANTVGGVNTIYGPGSYGFFDPNTYLSQTISTSISGCCPLILVSASLLSKDKIGPFHGGYQETNKSKIINPKYVQKVYKVNPCTPQQSVVSIGTTPYTGAEVLTIVLTNGGAGYTNGTYTNVPLLNTAATGTGATANITVAGGILTVVTIVNDGGGYTAADTLHPDPAFIPFVAGVQAIITISTVGSPVAENCCFDFICGETYYLRLDIKGSPALRAFNHNTYQIIPAYTGCCAVCCPAATVDPTLVYILWADAIILNPYMTPFIMPVVFDYTGVAWYAPGTTVTLDGTATPVTAAQWWTNYPASAQALAWTSTLPNTCQAGMRLYGAFVETKFGNCSFQITDFFEKEPVKILASMVDFNGDPCTFEGICVVPECLGVQGMGFGEQVVRDLILAESYLQNFFATDIRIREITQGFDILNAVNRNFLYTRYYILHSVPRWNNPTGVFDADRYMLEIISTGTNAALETFLTTWLGSCANCVTLEIDSCTPCVIIPD